MKKFIHILVLLLMVFLFISTDTLFAQDKKGKLEEFEDEVEKDSDSDDDDNNEDNDRDNDSSSILGDAFSDLFGQILWEMAEGMVRLVFYGLPADDYDSYKLNNFSKYPFADNGTYYSTVDTKSRLLQIKTTGYAGLENITGIEQRISYSFVPAVTLTSQFTSLTENLDGSRDVMNLGTLFINYNRFRTRRTRYSYGLGVKVLARRSLYVGPAVNFEFDWFMKKPVSAYYYWNGGLLNGNGVTGLQIGLNYHIRHVCLGFGYRGYRAGSIAIHGVSFSFGGYF